MDFHFPDNQSTELPAQFFILLGTQALQNPCLHLGAVCVIKVYRFPMGGLPNGVGVDSTLLQKH